MPHLKRVIGLSLCALVTWAWQKEPVQPAAPSPSVATTPRKITTRTGRADPFPDVPGGDTADTGFEEEQRFTGQSEGGIGRIGGDLIIVRGRGSEPKDKPPATTRRSFRGVTIQGTASSGFGRKKRSIPSEGGTGGQGYNNPPRQNLVVSLSESETSGSEKSKLPSAEECLAMMSHPDGHDQELEEYMACIAEQLDEEQVTALVHHFIRVANTTDTGEPGVDSIHYPDKK